MPKQKPSTIGSIIRGRDAHKMEIEQMKAQFQRWVFTMTLIAFTFGFIMGVIAYALVVR